MGWVNQLPDDDGDELTIIKLWRWSSGQGLAFYGRRAAPVAVSVTTENSDVLFADGLAFRIASILITQNQRLNGSLVYTTKFLW